MTIRLNSKEVPFDSAFNFREIEDCVLKIAMAAAEGNMPEDEAVSSITSICEARILYVEGGRNYVKYYLISLAAIFSILFGLVFDIQIIDGDNVFSLVFTFLMFACLLWAMMLSFSMFSRFTVQESICRMTVVCARAKLWGKLGKIWKFAREHKLTANNLSEVVGARMDAMMTFSSMGSVAFAVLAIIASRF